MELTGVIYKYWIWTDIIRNNILQTYDVYEVYVINCLRNLRENYFTNRSLWMKLTHKQHGWCETLGCNPD